MAQKLSYQQYRKLVNEQGQSLLNALAQAAHGELDIDIPIPEGIDVLTDLAIGFNFLLDDLRVLVEEQNKAQHLLEERVAERTQELEQALIEVQAVQRRYIEGQWTEYAADAIIGDAELPPAWASVLETAVVQQQAVTHTNGETTLGLPVQYADEIIGLLGFGADIAAVNWDQDELAAVESIADQIGLALENQRLFDQTQAALNESSMLYEASARLNAAESTEDILSVLAQYTILGENAHHLSLNIFDVIWTKTETPEFVRVLARQSSLPEAVLRPQYSLAVFPEISTLLRYNGPTIIEDMDSPEQQMHESVHRLYRDLFKAGSTIFVPLAVGTQWLGFINAVYPEKRTFAEDDLQRALALASQAAVALSNRLLLANTQERAAQLETLSHVEVALSQANNEEEILKALMQGFDLTDVSAIALNYLNPQQPDGSLLMDMYGFWSNGRFLPDDLLTRFRNVKLDSSPLHDLWQPQRSTVTYIDNINAYEGATEAVLQHAKENNWQASVIMPLRRGGDTQALVWLTWHQPHIFSETETFLFDRLLESVSAVVSSRRAQLAQQEALAETASLYRASAELNAAQTYDEILSVVRKYTIAGRDAQSVSFSMFDRPWTDTQMPEWVEVLRYYSKRENAAIPTRFKLDQFPSAANLLKPDETTVLEDLTDPDLDIDENVRHLYKNIFGANAVIFAPLVAGGQWIGYINVLYKEKTKFAESTIRRLASISGQSAVAIQNLGLLETTARKAQREQMLREITARVRSSADIDTIMKTAVQEIGRALGKKTYIYIESGKLTSRKDTSPLEEPGA
jgi:GAF domain-containing protein